MKKYISFTIVIFLIALIALTLDHIFINKNTKDITPINKNSLSLSDSKLASYLSYIPNELIEKNNSVYVNLTNVDNIDINILLGKSLNDTFRICNEQDTCETKKSDILGLGELKSPNGYSLHIDVLTKQIISDDLLKKYNKSMPDIKEGLSEYIASYNKCYWYNNGYFIENACARTTNNTHLSSIAKYEITNNELIIYEYAALAKYNSNNKYNIVDYYSNQIIYLDDSLSNIKTYFKEHQTEFTIYKHTFKQNSTGYYWYQTELG